MAKLTIEIKAKDVYKIKQLKRDIRLVNSAIKSLLFLNFITFGCFIDRFEYQAEILYNKLIDCIEAGDYEI